MGFIVVWLIVLAVANCDKRLADSPLNLRLTNGRTVGDLVATSSDTIALLLYHSKTCFTCGTSLPAWQELARAGRIRLVLILVGTVTKADQDAIRLRRIHVGGIAASGQWPDSLIPAEYVVTDGTVVAQAEGRQLRTARLWEAFFASPLLPEPSIADTPHSR